MKNLFKKAFVATAACLLAAVASAVIYYGFNPITGLNTFQGTTVSAGALPVLSSTTTSCGTYATVQASMVGGASAWQVTANSAGGTCTLKFTFPSAAPNGYYCVAYDETTVAKLFPQTAHDTVSCTISGATVASSDLVLVEVNGF
ncbi:MAG: hypothetical protein ACHQ9S_18740 [Candidatus Binatia bacterium]